MSAMNYFRDVADIRWRLADTILYIGNTLWRVRDVNSEGEIYLADATGKLNPRWVSIKRLPASALWRAPRGYLFLEGLSYWTARGPSRDRQQGLTPNSIWSRELERGCLSSGMFALSGNCYLSILHQKETLQPYKKGSLISRDVLTKDGQVYYKGVAVGEAAGRKAKLTVDSPQLKIALERVGLNVKS